MSERRCECRALAMKVIAVAVEGYVGDWAAYIDAVPGQNHDREWLEVREHGNKLPRSIAEAIFPNWKATKMAYRG